MADSQPKASSPSIKAQSSEEVDIFEGFQAKDVQSYSNRELAHEDLENNGVAYKDVFDALQIQPGQQKDFYRNNFQAVIKHMFNPPNSQKTVYHNALFNCDESARLRLSETFLRALGNTAWAKDRRWLLTKEELPPGVEPLQYHAGKDNKGFNDRFYSIIDPMWPRMRKLRFHLKGGSARRRSESVARQRTESLAPQPVGESATQKFPQPEIEPKPKRERKPKVEDYLRHEWPNSLLAKTIDKHLNTEPTQYTEDEAESAVQLLVQCLMNIKQSCPSGLFERICIRNGARLDEIQFSNDQEADVVKDKDPWDISGYTNNLKGKEREVATSGDVDMTDDTTKVLSDDSMSSLLKNIAEPRRALFGAPDSHMELVSALINPALPTATMISITKFQGPDSFTQTYSWIDAPIREDSYLDFRKGFILRAEVPDSIDPNNLIIVFSYDWNKYCRIIRNEQQWRMHFIADLRAAAKRKVDIWRMRACCVVQQ